jgi:O-antigen/teichoic acid export membrane protein
VFVKGSYLGGGVPGEPRPAIADGAGARRIGASVAASLAGKAAEMVTLLLLATVVPRLLGPADYGRFSVPLTIVTIGSLALTLGGPTLMARFVPAAAPEDRVALARAIGGRLARGRAAQLAALAAAALAAVAWDPQRFPPLVTGLVVGALALNVATTLALQVTLGLGRTGAWSVRYPVQNAVLIVAVLALHPVAGATGATVAILISAVVGAGFGVAVAGPVIGAAVPSVAVPAGAIRFGALQAAGAALVQFSHRGGVLAVALLAASPSETGFAALAIGIALGVTYAVLQAFTVALPHLADGDGAASGPTDAAEAGLRRLAGGLLAALVPAAALLALVLDAAVPAVFGDGYEGAVSAFVPALALVVLAPLNALAVQAAALRLLPEVALASGLASALAFVIVALAAVPAWGAAGGTAAALAGAAAGALVSLWRLPGAAGARLGGASLAGAAAVLVLAVVA